MHYISAVLFYIMLFRLMSSHETVDANITYIKSERKKITNIIFSNYSSERSLH